MRRGRLVVAAVLLFSLPGIAQAWGDKGHRITGLVAQALLTDTARARLKELMGDDDLASMALYLDQTKSSLESRIPGTRKWHYDDVPVCGPPAHADARTCPKGDCASVRMREYQQVLRNHNASVDDRRFAVLVLTHLIGDIHQPLHAATHEDKGGNDVRILLDGAGSAKPNLHGAWDYEIIERLYRGRDERDVAAQLLARYRGEVVSWQRGGFGEWMADSNRLARGVVYGRLPGFRCDVNFGDPVALDANYLAAAEAVIPEQLARAGARIAFILNRALAP